MELAILLISPAQQTNINNSQEKRPKISVAITPDTTTLEYYQSIYTHCKQRFNITDGIKIVKKTLYQYIENHINNYLLENYNISEVRSNLYNNLYCEETYPVQSKYFIDFESKTKTSNKGKQKLKQHSSTTLNTLKTPKTTAKHLQTFEQGTSVKLPLFITLFLISLTQSQTPNSPLNYFSRPENFQLLKNSTQQQKPISTSTNLFDYLQENESNYSENLESKETKSEPEETTENKEEMTTVYIAKITKFTSKDNNTSSQEWLDKVQKAGDTNSWNAARMLKAIPYFLQRTAKEWFENLEELFENWQAFKDILDQFIAELKNKLIKKVYPYVSKNLTTAIRHTKNYKMAMKEANYTKLQLKKKLTNLQKKLRTILPINNNSNNHKNISHYSDKTKTTTHYQIAKAKVATIVRFQNIGNKIAESYKETNKTGIINQTNYYQPALQQQYQQPLLIQQYQQPPTQQYQNNNNRINSNNQLVFQNSDQQRPNYYHTQLNYLTISNPSNNTILPAQITQNANLSDIFLFEFEANKSPFLLTNTAVNKQKAITAIYTKAKIEGKLIQLILNNESAGSIITYQLIQQLQKTVDRPAQTVIVIANEIKKTPVREIDNFLFTIDGITIPISYQEQYTKVPIICGTFNKKSEKAPVFEFEEEKKLPITETFMTFESTSSWAKKTKQKIFEETRE
ncbi:hypothetical protein G9A89_003740 [Geosiphon pyriformis]|nr:hypothetical protein G9A89_003740 [Geosiphon pyriformis]